VRDGGASLRTRVSEVGIVEWRKSRQYAFKNLGVDAQASEEETKAAMSQAGAGTAVAGSKLTTKPRIPEAKPARSALDWVADTSNPICSSF
jgi:hypothetical protein